MNPRSLMLVPLVLFISSCASQRARDDGLCHALRIFANAQVDAQPHSVTLHTAWMTSADTLSSKYCERDGYAPSERLCRYLLENAATEYPQDNLRNAVACLAVGTHQNFKNGYAELQKVRYHFIRIPGVKEDVNISLEYQEDRLTITAELSRQ